MRFLTLPALICGAVAVAGCADTRQKTEAVPAMSITPPLSAVQPQILAAIAQLDLDPPRQPLTYLHATGTVTYKGVTRPVALSQFMALDATNGQLAMASRAEGYESQALTFRGLFQLAIKTDYSIPAGQYEMSHLKELSFRGDWKHLPVGETVSFRTVVSNFNSKFGPYEGTFEKHCTVEREVPASEVNPAFKGSAKLLSCTFQPDPVQRISHLYYLMDAGLFFEESVDKNPYPYTTLQIDQFK